MSHVGMRRGVALALMALLCLVGVPAWAALPDGVQSFAPTGRVADNVSFRLVFKNAVVAKDDVGKPVGMDGFPFTVSPPVQAEGKWTNERTFTATLLAPLKMGTEHVATLKEGLKDRRGGKIGSGTFRFHTDGLTVEGASASMERDGRARLSLSFNMKVDPARLRGFLSVLDQKGDKLDASIAGGLPSRSIQLLVPVRDATARQDLTVQLAAGLTGVEGDRGLETAWSSRVSLEPELMVRSVEADDDEIALWFNFEVDPEAIKDHISLDPAVPFRVVGGWSDSRVRIMGDELEPRSRFVVSLRRGLPSKQGGLALREDHRQAVIMPDLDPQVSLPSSGQYLTAIGGALVPVELVNVKRLRVDLWRLYESNVPFVARGDYLSFPRDLARLAWSKELDLSLPLNERVRRSLSIEDMAGGERGLFLLSVRDLDGEYWDEQTLVLDLSDMGVVARVWEDGLLVWANTLTGTEPVEGATVRVWSGANQLLAEGQTDAQGLFLVERGEAWGEGRSMQPRLVTVSKGNDLTWLKIDRGLLSRETFDTAGRPWIRDGYDAIIFSPRDIYRTGESATFKAVVRAADVSVPGPFPVLFVARDPLGRKTKQETVELDGEGGALFGLDLPPNALTGLWTVALAVPGKEDEPLATMSFHVEDFAPPRIEVDASTDAVTLSHEDAFDVALHAKWLFGVEGAGLRYRASWMARPGSFVPKADRWRGYSFGDPERKFAPQQDDFEEGALDAEGRAGLTLTLDAPWEAATTIDVTIRAEVMEDGGRWVSSSVTRPYFPQPWMLGIAAPEGDMPVGQDLSFKVAAVAPDEGPADPGQLTATLYRVTWNYDMVEVDGRRRWQSSEELTQVDEKTFTVKDGLGSFTFRAPDWGTWLVRVSDRDDGARAVCRFWATSPQYADRGGSQLLDRVEIELDKPAYRPGDVAKVTLRSPFAGLCLLTVEGAGLASRTVHRVDEGEVVIDVPVTEAMVPNAWAAAWLIRPVREDDAWGAHRAVGLARILADVSDKTLSVAMAASDAIEPMTDLPVTLTLRDSTGAPAKGTVSLALVDDAVLGLTGYATPDLAAWFWGPKELASDGYDMYDQLMPVEGRATELLHPAGGAGMAALAGDSSSQRFKILSLFEGTLSADADGVVRTTLPVPEHSGRGRLFAVVTAGDKFGKAEQQVQIARQIVVEAGMPRFAAPGDTFHAPVTVFSTSDEDRDVELSITIEGGLEASEAKAALKVPAGGQARWDTLVTATEPGDAKWTVSASWTEDGERKGYEQTIELPVRSPWPVVSRAGSMSFEPGQSKISLPTDAFIGDVQGTLTLTDAPVADLSAAALYLAQYPYGCLEQTVSAAWPFLVLPDAIAAVDPLLIDDRAVRAKTEGALARLQAMQLFDGSFAAWPGSDAPYEWGSVYATHFLIEAARAGVAYPEDMLEGARRWLRGYMASLPTRYEDEDEERDDATTKAYGAYVMALDGDRPLGWIAHLKELEGRMWPAGRIWLAGAQALVDGRADALRELGTPSLDSPSAARRRTLSSEARDTALLLSLWADAEPKAPETAELAARVLSQGRDGRWYSTQDNAAAALALARYSMKAGWEKADLRGKVTAGGAEILSYESGRASSVPVAGLPSELTLDMSGKGRGHLSWSIMGAPSSQPRAERKGVDIEATWMDEQGRAVDLSRPVAQGTRMRCVLTIRPSMPVSDLAVSVLLPAGLELENARLDEDMADEGEGWGVVSDVRDDRLILFFDRLTQERPYGFKVRAVTKGTFAVPPISAVGMYDPAVRFTGKTGPALTIE